MTSSSDEEEKKTSVKEHHATLGLYMRDKLNGEVFGITNRHVTLLSCGHIDIKEKGKGPIRIGTAVKDLDEQSIDIGLVKINKNLDHLTKNHILLHSENCTNVTVTNRPLCQLYDKPIEKYRPRTSVYGICLTNTSQTGVIASATEHEEAFEIDDHSGQFLVKCPDGNRFAAESESGTAIALRRKSPSETVQLVGIICGGRNDTNFTVCLHLKSILSHLNDKYGKDLELCDWSPIITQEIDGFEVVTTTIPCGVAIFFLVKTPEQVAPYSFDLVKRTKDLLCCNYESVDEATLAAVLKMKKILSDQVNARNTLINCHVFDNDKPEYVATERGMVACDYLYQEDPKSAEEHLKVATSCILKSQLFGLRLLCKHVTYVTWYCLAVNTKESLEEMEKLLDLAIEVFDENQKLKGFPTESLGYLYNDYSRYFMTKYDNIRQLPLSQRNSKRECELRKQAVDKAILAKELYDNMHKKENSSATRTRLILVESQAAFSLLGCGTDFNIIAGEIDGTDLKEAEIILEQAKQESADIPHVQKTDLLIALCDLNYRKGDFNKALELAMTCLDCCEEKKYPLGIREAHSRIKYISQLLDTKM